MSLFNNEQFGENVKIWMGQIVDDEYWKDNEQAEKWSDLDDIPGWGARYKVRIFGNHPENANDLKNEELPWIEVMYPVTAGSGHAGSSQTSNLRKGAFVIGLYRDKDENEPFIIGCLGNNDQTKLNYQQTDKGFTTLSGFGGQNPENVPGYSQSQSGGKKTEANTTSATKEKTKTDEKQKKDGERSNALKKTTKCGGNELSAAQKSIQKLILDIEEFKDNYQNNLITEEGQSYGLREYIQYKVTNAAKEISKPIKTIINHIRKYITEKVNNGLKDLYYIIFPEDRSKAKTVLEKALELLSCLFDKIVDNLLKMIGQFLMQIVDRFINTPLCAVENFLAQLLGEIVSLIMGAVDAILGPLEAIFGAIDVAIDVLTILLDIIGFFSCNQDPECPDITEWSIWDGANSNLSLDINSVFNKAKGVADQFKGSIGDIANFDYNIDFAGMLQSTLDSCNVGPLLCGPPTLSIYGGGSGEGTSGNVIVSAVGDILGVDIITPGSGYTKQPFLKIIDNCGKGNGAVVKPQMGIVPPELDLTATKQPNGTYDINWKTKKADKVETSFGSTTLNGTINVNPDQTSTYTVTAFGKKIKNSERPYITKSITLNVSTQIISENIPIISGVPIRDAVSYVTSDIPEYPGNIGNPLGPDGNNSNPSLEDPCSDTPIIKNLLSTGKFTSDQIGIINIVVLDSGAGYLSKPDGSLGGDGRTWAQPNETVIRRNDGTYDKPYKPGEVISVNKCDQVNPPDQPTYQPDGPIILTAPEPTGGPVRAGTYATKDTGEYPVFLYLCGIEIEDAGANYDKDIDSITITPDNGAVLEPVFGPGGRLIDIKIIKNGFGFTERPVITIKTTTGYNAKINPILCVNRLNDDPIAASRIPADKIIKVVDCVGKI